MKININCEEYMFPIFVTQQEGENVPALDRYAGIGFFVGDQGLFITCKHVVDHTQENEQLLAIFTPNEKHYFIQDVKRHQTKDFAIGYLPNIQNYKRFALDGSIFSPGEDVFSYGFTQKIKQDSHLTLEPRLRKGYIVRTSVTPFNNLTNSVLETSFPVDKGFSGAPLISLSSDLLLAGMLHGNSEASILQHFITDIEEDGNKYTEKVNKIVEFGLAHSNRDILQFLSDLGIKI